MIRTTRGIVVLALFIAALGACQTAPTENKTLDRPAGTAPTPPKKPASPAPVIADGARNLAQNCFTCHGPSGRSPGSIPSLATLSASDIAKYLHRFRDGETFSTVMGRLANGYSDAEIAAIAKYIAGLKK